MSNETLLAVRQAVALVWSILIHVFAATLASLGFLTVLKSLRYALSRRRKSTHDPLTLIEE